MYRGLNKRVEIEHVNCKTVFSPTPNSFLRGSRCPTCSKLKQNKTHRQYEEDFYKVANQSFVLISEYKGSLKEVEILHETCGKIFKKKASYFLENPRCPCERYKRTEKKILSNYEKFFKELPSDFKENYTVISEYKNASAKIGVLHNECGEIYYTSPRIIKGGSRCPTCARIGKGTVSQDKIYEDIYKLVGEEYSFSEYRGISKKAVFKHNECGHEWELNPYYFIKRGSRCPMCIGATKGEKTIETILSDKEVLYSFQVGFDRSRRRFDFLIGEKVFIEYDGEFHFYPITSLGKNKSFLRQIKNDKIKNQYCIDNSIPLIRIPYWEFDNIESILTSALSYYNLLDSEEEYDKELFKEFLVDENWVHDDYIAKCPKNKKKLEEEIK